MEAILFNNLADATVQEIQLELIRRTQFNAFNGEQVVRSLLKNRSLWVAVMMDRLSIIGPGKLPSGGLIKLRDLADGFWNVDTLYILTPDAKAANELVNVVETEDWGGMVQVYVNQADVDCALGTGRSKEGIVSIWWD